jgi:hypothetical protein
MPETGIYIDDIFYGTPPKKIDLYPEEHTIGRFSQKAYEEVNGEEKSRMNNAIVKVVLESGTNYQLIFFYKCDTGGNKICSENEWYFGCDLKKK